MTGKLPSGVLASGLIRLAESHGGFGVVVAKGDPTSGSVAILLREKGGNPRFFERVLESGDIYGWRESAQPFENEGEVDRFLDRRKNFDPDLWIIELDIASGERFAAEMTTLC